jgi:hypothetical protein
VEVLTREPEWWQIRYAGRIGWAYAQYLSLIEPDIDEPGDTEQEIRADPDPDPVQAAPAQDPQTADYIAELRGIRGSIDRVIRMMGGEQP